MSRPVRFNIHPKEANINDAVGVAEAPEGYAGEGFFTARLSDVVGLARKNSMWPLPFATSCCGIEFMATMAPHYDIARFGAERVGFLPTSVRSVDGNGNHCQKNGPGFTSGISANGRTPLGVGRRCLCLQRRYF